MTDQHANENDRLPAAKAQRIGSREDEPERYGYVNGWNAYREAAIAALAAPEGAALASPNGVDDLSKLQRFAAAILGDDEIGDVDGGSIQDFAEACGLLVPTTVSAPCSEECRCAEYGDFPTTCYRQSPGLMRAYQTAALAAQGGGAGHG
jgi:hypothetical protein